MEVVRTLWASERRLNSMRSLIMSW